MLGEQRDLDRPEPGRFPALDPELSRSKMTQRRLRNAAVTAAAIVVLAGLGGLTAYLAAGPAGTARHAGGTRAAGQQKPKTLPASAAPAGRVLSLTPHGALAVSDLRGHAPTPLMSLPRQVSVSPTLDNRYFVTTNGQLLSFGAHDHLTATRLANVSQSTWSPGSPEPLADHDHYLALEDFNLSNSQADGSPISIRSLATSRSQSLGTGDVMSADPADVGVITSVPAPPVVTSNPSAAPQNGEWPDGKVVLRDRGRKDVLLGTAVRLNADVHLPAGTPTYLYPVPDPAGDKIAVIVQPQIGRRSGGVVVVSRTGRELYAASGLGRYVFALSWSPSGLSLAMPARAAHGSTLHIWTAGRGTSVQQFPGHADYGYCSWSPDGAWILCAAGGPHATGEQWVVASAAGQPMIVTKGPGFPVTWLGNRPGS
jgi:hypothetical protein